MPPATASALGAILCRVHAFLPRTAVLSGAATAAGAAPLAASLYTSAVALQRAAVIAGAGGAAATDARRVSTTSSSVLAPQSLRYDNLRDNPGAKKPKRKKGRGVGGGHGLARSAGEGSKGQKSHQGGGIPLGFEGGQSPLWRRTPKYGYMNKMFRREMDIINLSQLQLWIDQGRVDASKPINIKTLVDAGLVNKVKHGVKLLGEGAEGFKAKVDITVSQASASAIAAVEGAGGTLLSVYLSPLALRAVVKPHKFPIPIRSPLPTPNVARYYKKEENRGYLAPAVQLATIKRRLAAGMPLPLATAVHPVFVGGAPYDPAVHLVDIQVDAADRVAAVQGQGKVEGAKAAAQ